MPSLEERLALAERTMTALVAGAELPPKIGVHPRPAGSFAHAMPAHLSGADPAGADDLLGIKWVTGFGGNRSRGDPGHQCHRDPQRPGDGATDRCPRWRADHRDADGGRDGRRRSPVRATGAAAARRRSP